MIDKFCFSIKIIIFNVNIQTEDIFFKELRSEEKLLYSFER